VESVWVRVFAAGGGFVIAWRGERAASDAELSEVSVMIPSPQALSAGMQ